MANINQTYMNFDLLINGLLGAAQNLVRQFGEFYPFGGVINVIGKFELIETLDNSEKPQSKEILAILGEGLLAGLRDGRYRAVGVCVNVTTVSPKTGKIVSAIRVNVQQTNGQQAVFFVPYLKDGNNTVFKDGYFQEQG